MSDCNRMTNSNSDRNEKITRILKDNTEEELSFALAQRKPSRIINNISISRNLSMFGTTMNELASNLKRIDFNGNGHVTLDSVLQVLCDDNLLRLILSFTEESCQSASLNLYSNRNNDDSESSKVYLDPYEVNHQCCSIMTNYKQAIFGNMDHHLFHPQGKMAMYLLNKYFHSNFEVRRARVEEYGLGSYADETLDRLSELEQFIKANILTRETYPLIYMNHFGTSRRYGSPKMTTEIWYKLLHNMTLCINTFLATFNLSIITSPLEEEYRKRYGAYMFSILNVNITDGSISFIDLYRRVFNYLRVGGSNRINIHNLKTYFNWYKYMFLMLMKQNMICLGQPMRWVGGYRYVPLKHPIAFRNYIMEDALVGLLCKDRLLDLMTYDDSLIFLCTHGVTPAVGGYASVRSYGHYVNYEGRYNADLYTLGNERSTLQREMACDGAQMFDHSVQECISEYYSMTRRSYLNNEEQRLISVYNGRRIRNALRDDPEYEGGLADSDDEEDEEPLGDNVSVRGIAGEIMGNDIHSTNLIGTYPAGGYFDQINFYVELFNLNLNTAAERYDRNYRIIMNCYLCPSSLLNNTVKLQHGNMSRAFKGISDLSNGAHLWERMCNEYTCNDIRSAISDQSVTVTNIDFNKAKITIKYITDVIEELWDVHVDGKPKRCSGAISTSQCNVIGWCLSEVREIPTGYPRVMNASTE